MLRSGDKGEVAIRIPKIPLMPGEFAISLALGTTTLASWTIWLIPMYTCRTL